MASLIYLAAGWVLPRAVRVAGPCLSSSSPAPAHSQGSGLKSRKRGGKPNPQGLFKSVGHTFYCLISQSKSYDRTQCMRGIYLRIVNTVRVKRVTAALFANNVPCCLTGLVRMPNPGKWSECVSQSGSLWF